MNQQVQVQVKKESRFYLNRIKEVTKKISVDKVILQEDGHFNNEIDHVSGSTNFHCWCEHNGKIIDNFGEHDPDGEMVFAEWYPANQMTKFKELRKHSKDYDTLKMMSKQEKEKDIKRVNKDLMCCAHAWLYKSIHPDAKFKIGTSFPRHCLEEGYEWMCNRPDYYGRLSNLLKVGARWVGDEMTTSDAKLFELKKRVEDKNDEYYGMRIKDNRLPPRRRRLGRYINSKD